MAKFLDLPMELVVEIMSFLPAESLVRFKCVCKLWYSIINDRGFVAKHLRNAIKISSTKSLCFTGYGKEFEEPVSSFLTIYDEDKNGEHVYSVVEDSLSPFFQRHRDEYLVSSQCNGIFCLYGEQITNNVILCNPATGEFKLLPDSCFRVKTCGIMFGFGYDPSVDSYKVVRAVLLDCGDNLSLRAEVCTAGSSSWREIELNFSLSQLEVLILSIAYGRNVHKQRYCNGACYWLLSPMRCEEETIICFDMSDEQFCRISLPVNIKGEQEGRSLHTSLAIWNESVALFHYSYDHVTRPIDIWVMLDNSSGVSKASCCWTKQLSIGPLEGICRPILFWKTDEILMSTDDGRAVSYNLHTKRLGSLPIPLGSLMCNTSVYIKSLVSVHGRI